MPWVNRPVNGSSIGDVTGLVHGAGEEARIEEMQDRVLDAADILIDRQPIADGIGVDRLARVRRAEARKIPGRIDEGVHRVGLARGRTAALRAGDVLPGRMAVERIARPRRRSRPPAASPVGPSPAPARCRIARNGSSGSGSPNSAAARYPNRVGGTAVRRSPCGVPFTRFLVKCSAIFSLAASTESPSRKS